MRNSKSHTKTLKTKLKKSKNIFFAFNNVQFQYGKQLDLNEDVVEIKSNVKLIGCSLGDNFTSDFVCTKKNGELMVRECVIKDKLLKPLTLKMLDSSRNFWLSNNVTDWGIVIGNE